MYRLRYALINATDRRVRVFTRVTVAGAGVRTRTDTRAPVRQRNESDCVSPTDTRARRLEMHLHTRESVRDVRKHNQGRAGQKH